MQVENAYFQPQDPEELTALLPRHPQLDLWGKGGKGEKTNSRQRGERKGEGRRGREGGKSRNRGWIKDEK